MMQKKEKGSAAYRRVFGSLKQAREFRDDFYASYGVQSPEPGAHIRQEGEGWVVELSVAEQLKFAQEVYRRLMLHPEAEPTSAFRFVWVRRPVPQKDGKKEQDSILFNVMMRLRTFTPQQMSWQLLALSTYRAWDINKIPSLQERAEYEAQVVKDLRIGSHTLAPTMVGLYPEYVEFTVDPEMMSISSLRYLMHYEAQEDRDLEDEGDALRKEKWVARSRTQFNRRLVQMAEELRAHNVIIADTSRFARRVSWLDDNGYFTEDTGALSSQKEDYPGFYGEVLSGQHQVSLQRYMIQRSDGKFLSKINDQGPSAKTHGFGFWFAETGLMMTSQRARQVMSLLQCEDVTLVLFGEIED
jgi:hypothetical protein